jgi:hypothetical protein
MTEAVAPVVPTPVRNRLGIAALILVLVAIGVPIIGFIVGVIISFASAPVSDATGYYVAGAFFAAGGIAAFTSILAIVGIVLAIIALTRKAQRKLQAILAIILGIAPALFVFGIPTTIAFLS